MRELAIGLRLLMFVKLGATRLPGSQTLDLTTTVWVQKSDEEYLHTVLRRQHFGVRALIDFCRYGDIWGYEDPTRAAREKIQGACTRLRVHGRFPTVRVHAADALRNLNTLLEHCDFVAACNKAMQRRTAARLKQAAVRLKQARLLMSLESKIKATEVVTRAIVAMDVSLPRDADDDGAEQLAPESDDESIDQSSQSAAGPSDSDDHESDDERGYP
ncbi:hypothetical protein DFJ77DRAFT_459592 [Powellomyces hirtus]|nr:hypothetical protein DFJ77DRAFT_459592 [Powellomyces hirtus]